ncbi:MAG: hypothetical protein GTO28_17830 [Gammaproteobacteria bacterium]|nr:hypothetical protein [Gammaproteobacteria bacterium]NIQ28509.1 hypothetical protein [Gammaproteobacteria bacterium]
MKGSWKGIASAGALVGIGVIAGVVALNVRSPGQPPAAVGQQTQTLAAGTEITVYKTPT